MVKLVLLYDVSDSCTYSATQTIPFEYESKEKAEYDLFEQWEQYNKETIVHREYCNSQPFFNLTINQPTIRERNHKQYLEWVNNFPKFPRTSIYLGKIEIDPSYISYENKYSEPEILTLEEWFDKYKE